MTTIYTLISTESIIAAVLWFNAFIIITTLFRRKNALIVKLGVPSLIIAITLTLARVFLAFEMPHAITIYSDSILPHMINWLKQDAFLLNGHIVSIGSVAWAILIGVALFRLGAIAFKHHRMHIYLRNLPAVASSHEYAALQDVIEQRCAKRAGHISLVKSSMIDTPIMVGFFRPVIYIPAKVFSEKELYFIFHHELIHVVNHDAFVKLAVEIICSIMWWNPFTYILKRDIDRSLEFNCDYNLIKDMTEADRLDYIDMIIEFCRTNNMRRSAYDALSFIGYGQEAEIQQRFSIIMDYGACKKKPTRSYVLVLAIALCLYILSYGFVIQPYIDGPNINNDSNSVQPVYAVPVEDGYIIHYDENNIFKISAQEFLDNYSDVQIKDE